MKTRFVRFTFLVATAIMLMLAIAPSHAFAQSLVTLSSPGNQFPEQSVGTQSNAYTAVLTNGGISVIALTYSGADPNYPVLSDTCGATLAGGDSCQIQWEFSPQSAGFDELDYGISASINGNPVVISSNGESVGGVTLSGTGITGAVSLHTDGHNFGPWVVGTTSNAYLTVLTNTTSEMVNLSYKYAAKNDVNTFPLAGSTCGKTLLAGASCDLEWEFTPGATGALGTTYNITAIDACGCTPVSITSGTQTVPGVTLSGNGQETAGLSLATAVHNFGGQSMGSASATYGTVLYNTIGTPVTLSTQYSDPSAAANFTIVANNCGSTLATNASCNLEWQFSPVTAGIVSVYFDINATRPAVGGPGKGGLILTITSGGNPVEGVKLSGTGEAGDVKK